MNTDEFSAAALNFPGAFEDHPFGASPAVYKVENRIFAFVSADRGRPQVALKCDPFLAEMLRRQFPGVVPGYHLNKRHWNTVYLDAGIADDEILGMLCHSYERVVARLPGKTREKLLAELDTLLPGPEAAGPSR